MSDHADFDEEASRRTFTAPYTSRHPVPTVQGYQAKKQEREGDLGPINDAPVHANGSPKSAKSSKRKSLLKSAKGLLRRDGGRSASKGSGGNDEGPYAAENRNSQVTTFEGIDTVESHDYSQTQPKPGQDHSEVVANPSSDSREAESDSKPSEGESRKSGQELPEQPDGHPSQNEDISQEDNAGSGVFHDGGDASNDQGTSAKENEKLTDTSQTQNSALGPRQKRKQMKKKTRDDTDRQVTDPVTHLPVTIHDATKKELKSAPENESPPARSPTGLSKEGQESQIEEDSKQQQEEHDALQRLFPPPSFDTSREEMADVYGLALTVGLAAMLIVPLSLLVGAQLVPLWTADEVPRSWEQWRGTVIVSGLLVIVGASMGALIIYVLRGWLQNRIRSVWDDCVWDAARQQEADASKTPTPESVQWLNSLLVSIWGLINPDLFVNIADTLEDVMQASLPRLVRMVAIEDLGQGSEAIRILGIRWLPSGAAGLKVGKDGKIQAHAKQDNDRKVSGEGHIDKGNESTGESKLQDEDHPGKEDEQGTAGPGSRTKANEDQDIEEGLEAEEGDFVNLEVGFSYRAKKSGNGLVTKTKNAHLFMAFYLPGGIKFPVWVELRGIIVLNKAEEDDIDCGTFVTGTMRMRLQLCPDPPFVQLCTLTLLGQPRADISCTPLTRRGLNIMDLPVISSFVQSSIDAALAEYVAPKSLTVDLKDMMMGDDFKKDTTSRGVIVVRIKRGRDFKEGDSGMLGFGEGSSDAYVAVGWAKFGKPLWSTRVIMEDMKPVWEETTFILVGPEELNAGERLRVQLWDSDRVSADDDLGRCEVSLDEIMTSPRSKGKMWDRTDNFQALGKSDVMPGTLDWSVGYYAKTRIQPEQIQQQQVEPDVNSLQELKDKVSEDAERKLREAARGDETPEELSQQKAQDLKVREDAMVIATPPLRQYPTGILAIQIHNITGVEFEKISKSQSTSDEGEDMEGSHDDLPSPYCTIIINQQKIFQTRTKPKNAKPFFNAGTERLIRDWKTAEIIITVRDSRVHENDPLLGIIYLPLGKVLEQRCQIVESYPLAGGIGYGRARISMVFRSIELQAPKEILGWDYGTLQITGPVTSIDISPELSGLRIKLRTSVNRCKMYHSSEDGEKWTGKHDRIVQLGVRKRYCSCLVFEFRKNSLGLDKTPAFGILWLKDIPDEEDLAVQIPIWRTDKGNLKRAETNVVYDLGEKLGSLRVPLRFKRGVSAVHHKVAGKSPNLHDVFEVLNTARDNLDVPAEAATHPGDAGSDTDSSDDSDEEPANVNDGKGGPLKQIKNYQMHSDELHRRHRGLMQWKGARTAEYLKTKTEHGKDHLMDSFQHSSREPAIETEV